LGGEEVFKLQGFFSGRQGGGVPLMGGRRVSAEWEKKKRSVLPES